MAFDVKRQMSTVITVCYCLAIIACHPDTLSILRKTDASGISIQDIIHKIRSKKHIISLCDLVHSAQI